MVFAFLYWFLVVTIFLNLLFAIIIDTFFELRSDNKNRLSDAENVCFICGIERSTFDRNGVNWREHKLHEHDRWAYVYLLVHLRKKPKTEYNGWESYIASKLPENRSDGNRSDFTFFPMHRALSLRHLQERQEAEKAREQDALSGIATRQQRLVELNDASMKAIRNGDDQLAKTNASLSDMQRVATETARSTRQLVNTQLKFATRLNDLDKKVTRLVDAQGALGNTTPAMESVPS